MKVQSVVIEAKDLTIGYRHGKRGEVVHSHLNFALCRGELTSPEVAGTWIIASFGT